MAYWGPPLKGEEEEEEPLFFLPNLDELTKEPVPFAPSITTASSTNNSNIWGAPIVVQAAKNELATQKKKVAIEWTRIVQELKISAHLPAILEALEECNALGVPIQELDIVEFSFALAETDCPEHVRRVLIRKLNNIQLLKDEAASDGDISLRMREGNEELQHAEHIQDDHRQVMNSATRGKNEDELIAPYSEQVIPEIARKKEVLDADVSSSAAESHDLESTLVEASLDEDDAADKIITKQVDSRLQARSSESSSESAGSGSTNATNVSPDFGASPSLAVDNDAWQNNNLKEDILSLPKYSIDSTDSMVQSEEQAEPQIATKLRNDSVESHQHTQSDSDTASLEEEKKVNPARETDQIESTLDLKLKSLKKATSNEKRHDKWDKGKKKRKKKRSVMYAAEEASPTDSNMEQEKHQPVPVANVDEREVIKIPAVAIPNVHAQKYDRMIKLFHRTKTIVVEVHQLALSSDREVKWIFGFIFCFPEIVEWTIGHYAPSWASVCLFYAFLIQILCVDSGSGGGRREWKTSILRRVIPLAFLLDGVSHPSLLLGFDRYELLITATLISAIKVVHSLNPIVVLGMGVQVLFPLMTRDLLCHSIMCHSLMLYVQALIGLCCLVVAKGER